MYPDYNKILPAQNASVLIESVHPSNQYPLPSMKEKLVLLVRFLGNLMYYVQKQLETNMNTNTNK